MGYQVPRVQVVPLANEQVSFQVEGVEKLRWNFGSNSPRPFFFPVVGPAGRSVTRMGHPAAPNHDHHRSWWWGHHDVAGVNFWEERGDSQQIRQEDWIHYQDGVEEAGIATRIGWFDAHNTRLIQQQMIAVYRPLPRGESWIEIQSTFTPAMETLQLARTNFGFMGLRVAASISAQFGGGRLANSENARGEPAIFGQPARWVDYSGPIAGTAWEGLTWFDHPANPRYPTAWHVRDDGWMSAAFCLREAYTLTRKQPLQLRYGYHVHGGEVNAKTAEEHRHRFAESAPWSLVAAQRPWRVRLQRARK